VPPDVAAGAAGRSDDDPGIDRDLISAGLHHDLGSLAGVRQPAGGQVAVVLATARQHRPDCYQDPQARLAA
jgi:predicted HD phosphohydrolase